MFSFIIPAFNEERLIRRTLEAIHDAASIVDIKYELIVVDDNSSDNTGKIALDLGATVVKVNNRHISATRNSSARVASGELFIFIDADTIISIEILKSTITAIKNKAIGGSAALKFDNYVPIYGRVIQWMLYCLYRLGRVVGGAYFLVLAMHLKKWLDSTSLSMVVKI